ncbi:S-adenosyl-L-methionine-dependent methyltransferase [Ascodesmis nigricans]|uniref:catechol O-methyltransferase n=1 Tax=Ascodesmis nigricans TaxID=341454 RepID=A0A4S2MRT2_9PEZI|nr:S-adenosyl-L-methionine-dependent methyltransferase [Ascodesmis nigricans]
MTKTTATTDAPKPVTKTTTAGEGGFNAKYTYAEQGETYYNDGRELDLLSHIFSLPHLHSLRNNPPAILHEIDLFATRRYLMNIGSLKGRIITTLLATHAPRTSIELGGYVGYSTILFASAVRDAVGPEARYYCVEANPVFAAIIMALVDLAGLRDTVRVLVGESTMWIKKLEQDRVLENGKVDFLFLDHVKSMYTRDLKVLESLGMVKEGAVLVADNMVKPGNPEYHRWVNAAPEEKRGMVEKTKGRGEPANVVDGLEGDPELSYTSEWVESWEPQGVRDAIEITRVLGRG